MKTPLPEYEELGLLLQQSHLVPSAGEAHGMLCGLLAGHADQAEERWIIELLPQDPSPAREGALEQPPAAARDLLASERAGREMADATPDPDPDRLLRQALALIASKTEQSFRDGGLDLQPMLPHDDQSLAARALAVTEWTRGLLFGLGLARIDRQSLETETREAFDDLLELTRMDLDDLSEDEAHEMALSDVVEFLRVATLLIHDDIATQAPNDRH